MPSSTTGYPRGRPPADPPKIGATSDDCRRLRRDAGLTVQELAEEIGVGRTALTNVETRPGIVADWVYLRHQRAVAAIRAKRAAKR